MAAHINMPPPIRSLSSSMIFNSLRRDLIPGTITEEPAIFAGENFRIVVDDDPIITAAMRAADPIVVDPVIPRKTDEEIEHIAKNILTAMMEKFKCGFDILPQIVKLADLRANLEQDYAEYGDKFLEYLQYHIRLELIRTVLNSAAKRQLKDLEDLPASGLIASARDGMGEGGMGEDREAAVYAASQCALERIPTICVTIVDYLKPVDYVKPIDPNRAPPKLPSYAREHNFLLLGIEPSEFEILKASYHNKIHEILKRLQHGVLFDPSLKLICPLRQIATGGRKLLQYIKVRGIKTVWHTFTKSYEKWKKALADSERCRRAITEPFYVHSDLSLELTSKEKTVQEWVRLDIQRKLSGMFPKLTWNLDQGELLIKGNDPDVIQVLKDLQKHGIRIIREAPKKTKKPKPQIQRRCVIQDSDLTKLRQFCSASTTHTLTSSSSHSPSRILILHHTSVSAALPTSSTTISTSSTTPPASAPHSPSVLSPTVVSYTVLNSTVLSTPVLSPTQASTSSRLFESALTLTPPRISNFGIPKPARVAPLASTSSVQFEERESKVVAKIL